MKNSLKRKLAKQKTKRVIINFLKFRKIYSQENFLSNILGLVKKMDKKMWIKGLYCS